MNRRKFLGVSALAGAGAMVVPEITMASSTAKAVIKEVFPTRKLGKTGIEIPILSMGAINPDNVAVIRAAYNAGLIFFDTAYDYQNGRNEEALGAFFKDKDRSTFMISTRGGANLKSENFETEFEEILNTSLRRLQMNYVDIYGVHGIQNPEAFTDPRLINMLKKFKAEGKVKHIGFTTHANKPELIDEAIKSGVFEVCQLSYNFKLGNLPQLFEAIQRGADAGLGFIAMKTMAGGVENAEGKKKIDGAACLRWVWSNPNITTVFPGCSTFELLENCLEAARRPELDENDKKYLADLRDKNELLYCQNCEKCVKDCSKHLPIPDIMRAYMYNYGYKQPLLSKETLVDLALSNNVCSDCTACSVKCPSEFKVADKIAAITPIVNVPSHFLT